MIGLIGTGAMGLMLGKTLIDQGYHVTAFNRTAIKAEPLKSMGATLSNTVDDLFDASDAIIVCVSDYDAAEDILSSVNDRTTLRGKTIIQLTTGTPKDAMRFAAAFEGTGVSYLDGAIMVTPSQIGTSEAMILIAGDADVYAKHEQLLKCLAAQTLHVGIKVSLAAAWDLALLSYFFSALIGLTHAARIAEHEGIDLGELGAAVKDWSTSFGSIMKQATDLIHSGEYANAESTVKTCFISTKLIYRHAQDAGISQTYPAFAFDVFNRAMNNGLALEDGIAIFKTL
jgi:3-hydroxyisobutyrate dehydrogenase-like beta-hydroxyacid dehydrogenase